MQQPPFPVTILSAYYPPSPAVGALRAVKVAKAFQQAGHSVIVVTGCLPEERPGIRLEEPGLIVKAIVPWRNPREWYANWVRKRQRSVTAGASNQQPVQAYTIPKHVPLWKRFIFSLLWLPDSQQGFIGPAVREAMRSLRDPRAVIYTTAPPFSTHLAGLWLQRKTGRKWIAEFRDPWTDNPWKPWHVRTSMTDGIERGLERKVLGKADMVVAVSAGIARVFRPKIASPKKLLLIRNGIEHLAPISMPHVPNRPLRILHVGTFYHGRDPRNFLKALANILARKSLATSEVRVDLVGQARWYGGISITKEVEMLGLTDIVHFEDWVPHSRAQEMVQSADILLLFAQNQPDQVPNKLYEYLGTRRPILAFVDEDGESAALIRQIKGHELVTSNQVQEAESALERLLNYQLGSFAADEGLLGSLTTREQMKMLVSSVENL